MNKRTSKELTEELLRSAYPKSDGENRRTTADEVLIVAGSGPTDRLVSSISRGWAARRALLQGNPERPRPDRKAFGDSVPKHQSRSVPGLRPVVVSSGSTLSIDSRDGEVPPRGPSTPATGGVAAGQGPGQQQKSSLRKPYWYLPSALAADILGIGAPLFLAITASSGGGAYLQGGAAGLTWALIQAIRGRYNRRHIGERVLPAVLFRDWLTFIGTLSTLALLAGTRFSVALDLASLVPGLFITAAQRRLVRLNLKRRRRKADSIQRVLLLGTSSDVDHVVARLSRHTDHEFVTVGACLISDDQIPLSGDSADESVITSSGVSVAARLPTGSAPRAEDATAVLEAVRTTNADLVLVAPGPDMSDERLKQLSWALRSEGHGLAIVPGLTEVAEYRIQVASVAGLTVLHVVEAEHRSSAWLRSVLDRSVALASLLLLLPLLLAIAVTVRASSRGPALFRQERIGLRGEPFVMLKFRTMVTESENKSASLTRTIEGDGLMFKMRRDPRVTRVGRYLRKTSLDELPQLINILRGDMSLVGPRPHLPQETEHYNDVERRRLSVKPGLTGLWQISGRADLSWDEAVALDLRYIENQSFRGDMAVIMKTMRAVVDGQGAY